MNRDAPRGCPDPDSARSDTEIGEVTAIGDDVKEVKAGDRIVFTRGLGQTVQVDADSFVVLKESQVLAVLKKRQHLAAA
jgi:chaperonin GroES